MKEEGGESVSEASRGDMSRRREKKKMERKDRD